MDNKLLNLLYRYLSGLISRELLKMELENYKLDALNDINIILQVTRKPKDE